LRGLQKTRSRIGRASLGKKERAEGKRERITTSKHMDDWFEFGIPRSEREKMKARSPVSRKKKKNHRTGASLNAKSITLVSVE